MLSILSDRNRIMQKKQLAHSYRTCHWQLLPHAMANKRLTAQLYGEFREMFPENAVEYFVS
ncbi:MAG: hypothetical protein LUF00_09135 [Lachnospiraceae bacterium]|nr:hypothetical protein [Lachnospiraceae bacterium]